MAKYIELAIKLKELADKGTGGERVNAQQQLQRLMEKHGFTIDDIEGEKIDLRRFTVPQSSQRLFQQVACTVLGNDFEMFGVNGKSDVVVIKTTVSLAIELESKFEFYHKYWLDEMEDFFSAFVSLNNLYPKGGTPRDWMSLSKEERAKYEKAQKLAKHIDERSFLKQIR